MLKAVWSNSPNTMDNKKLDLTMQKISYQTFEGERPLFGLHDAKLDHVIILPGESALKETARLEVANCEFNGKYPFWHTHGFTIRDCLFREGARAALWYSDNLDMSDTLILAPKMFREMHTLKLKNVRIPHAGETLWYCHHIDCEHVEASEADYIFLGCSNIALKNVTINGNYSFQKTNNVEIENCVLNCKDAFWESENVTVRHSVINGEYLGWHSKDLTLINCTISGTQPLCYADNLKLINCRFTPDADLAFEYSSVEATIEGAVTSVKNPLTGHITADSFGEIILDKNIKAPADCVITTRC